MWSTQSGSIGTLLGRVAANIVMYSPSNVKNWSRMCV